MVTAPTRSIFTGSCACTAIGNATAAPPRSVVKSRRLMPTIEVPPDRLAPPSVGLSHAQPASERRLILGAELHCSGSGRERCADNVHSTPIEYPIPICQFLPHI